MVHNILRWGLVAVLLTAAAHPGAAFDLDVAGKADEYMQARERVHRFSGTVLIAKDGQIRFSKGFGMANLEWSIPNTPKTKFRLGSITKQFTSMAVMQLEERGKLKLEDRICDYLSDCPPAWNDVTIHHLLTHTSGIPSYTGMPDYRTRMMVPTSPSEMVGRFRDLALEFAPGEKFKYNNSGYFLLGLIIGKVSGKPYEDYLRENIFGPAGMQDSGYDRTEDILKNRAAGYSFENEKVVNAPYLDMLQPFSAGALYSTVEDLYRWDQALYGEKLLKQSSLAKLFAPFKDGYAYGWTVSKRNGRSFVGHGGGINGFVTDISRYPDDKACVVVLSNIQSGNAGQVARDLAAILFGEKYDLPAEKITVHLDPGIYDSFAGKYELRPDFVITITREGDTLMAQATGQPKFEIFPESETKFFLKVVEAGITFVKDTNGKVSRLILHQGGRDQSARRID